MKTATKPKGMITYSRDWEWNGYTLQQRQDGNWRYERWSAEQGAITGRVVVLAPPEGFEARNAADMDTRMHPGRTKADWLIQSGHEVRCIRRGFRVE